MCSVFPRSVRSGKGSAIGVPTESFEGNRDTLMRSGQCFSHDLLRIGRATAPPEINQDAQAAAGAPGSGGWLLCHRSVWGHVLLLLSPILPPIQSDHGLHVALSASVWLFRALIVFSNPQTRISFTHSISTSPRATTGAPCCVLWWLFRRARQATQWMATMVTAAGGALRQHHSQMRHSRRPSPSLPLLARRPRPAG